MPPSSSQFLSFPPSGTTSSTYPSTSPDEPPLYRPRSPHQLLGKFGPMKSTTTCIRASHGRQWANFAIPSAIPTHHIVICQLPMRSGSSKTSTKTFLKHICGEYLHSVSIPFAQTSLLIRFTKAPWSAEFKEFLDFRSGSSYRWFHLTGTWWIEAAHVGPLEFSFDGIPEGLVSGRWDLQVRNTGAYAYY